MQNVTQNRKKQINNMLNVKSLFNRGREEKKVEKSFFTEPNKLIRLTKDQVKPAARAVARAFQDYPLWISIFPDASERKQKSLPNMFEFLIRYGVLYGEVWATRNLEGVALWLPPDKIHMSMIGMMRAGGLKIPFKVGMKNMSRVMTSMEFTTKVHDRLVTTRHWYLFILGVDTVHQGKGFAGALLRPMLARIDEEGLPSFLETHDEKNVPLYEHFGFTVIEKADILGLDVTNWAMLREIR
ncbi:MAG: GNAT family N-acetyltransferase [Candidatus Hodarchaeales archaeon]|jgi:ribosomal protein S18 acetylase RimI-like enzyme